jgi:hypothetical protein
MSAARSSSPLWALALCELSVWRPLHHAIEHRPERIENFTFRCIPILYRTRARGSVSVLLRRSAALYRADKKICNLRSCRRGGSDTKLARLLDTRLYLTHNAIGIVGPRRMRHTDTNAWRALVQAKKEWKLLNRSNLWCGEGDLVSDRPMITRKLFIQRQAKRVKSGNKASPGHNLGTDKNGCCGSAAFSFSCC